LCLATADPGDARNLISIGEHYLCRSLWPRGLWSGSAAARLLGLWVRIPPEAWVSVSCECSVLSSRGLYVHRSPTESVVSKCDRQASIMMKPSPTRGCCPIKTTTFSASFPDYLFQLFGRSTCITNTLYKETLNGEK
jgi:hypothetical protein